MGGKKEYELTVEIGHKSAPLHQKQANGYTHKWTVYVKGVNNSRIDYCIQRVVFQLHESFDNPYRDISQPPYKIKETGYAGFEIPIEVYFKNKDKHTNHCVFVHDLWLSVDKEHHCVKPRKVKFINPDRDFEKCLIKAGAQLVTNVKKEKIKSPPPPPPLPPAKKKKRDSPPVHVKRERHDSPPSNKKQKSSSVLIPSKDMGKQPTPQSQSSNHHNHPHHNTSHNNNNNHHHHHSHHNHHSNHHNHHSNHHNHSHHNNTTNKVKPSKEFIDVFGAPLVYNQGNTTTTANTPTNTIATAAASVTSTSTATTATSTTTTTTVTTTTISATTTTPSHPSHKLTVNSNNRNDSSSSGISNIKQSKGDELHLIQKKISCLSDGDLLQKIVDIVEEVGEFNLTSKKFEFDLKRLDKKTLSKIEKCLQHC